MKHVVIVGAGAGGLAAACRLAQAGVRVTVFERAREPGGKAGVFSHQGFRWDTGPTLLTMPDVIESIVTPAGISIRKELTLAPLAPLCRYRFASGHALDHLADARATAEQLRAIDPRDAERYPAFVDHARQLFDLVGGEYLGAPFGGVLEFAARVARKGPGAVAVGTSLGTLDELAAKWFRSVEMRQFVGRLATYVGAAPDRASAALAMIAHVEGRGDASYPVGGMRGVLGVMARAARALGSVLVMDERVSRVARAPGGVGWDVTVAGMVVRADAVVLNVDPVYAGNSLMDPSEPFAAAMRAEGRRERSLSAAVLLFGLRGRTEGLATHNVFFPSDYPAEFDDVMRQRRVPRDGTVYVCAPAPIDPSCAPAGHETLFCLVNSPARTDLDWPAEFARLRAHVLARLSAMDPTIPSRVVTEHALGPREIAATGSLDGAIYGAAPHGLRGPFLRPDQRVPRARGLYLAGGCTHPGGGVPMAALSGTHAASLVLADLKVRAHPPAATVARW